MYDLLLSSNAPVDSQGFHPALCRSPPYVNDIRTQTMNQLITLSYYQQLMKNGASNPFSLHMGKEIPSLHVGDLHNRRLPARSRSRLTEMMLSPKYTTSVIDADRYSHESISKYHSTENHYNRKAFSDPKLLSKFLIKNNRGSCRQKRTIDWEDRMQMLIAFKSENGHCMVPQNHPQLGAWVKWQREKYTLFKEGKKNHFTQEKIDRLNAIGFVWRVRRKRTTRDSKNEGESGEMKTQDTSSCKKLKRSKGLEFE